MSQLARNAPAKEGDYLEFHAPLLRLQESSPNPLGRAVLWTLLVLLAGLVVWALVGRLDVVAIAEGRLVPHSYVKILQPPEAGIVTQILVSDGESVAASLRRLGPGGTELLHNLLEPGLNGPVGGNLAGASRAILDQTLWNLLIWGTWNLPGGVDRIPEAIAAQVPVRVGCRVENVAPDGNGIRVTLIGGEVLRARAALFALPGQLVASLCPTLPTELTTLLSATQYTPMASAHVALETPPKTPWAGYGFAAGVEDGVEVELEHRRAPGRCPDGCGLLSVYFYPMRGEDDTALTERARQVVTRHFPDAGNVRFVHLIRWPVGIAQFPPGRLTALGAFRRSLNHSSLPYEFAGDWLDGLSSEGALRTGEQAAERLARRLNEL